MPREFQEPLALRMLAASIERKVIQGQETATKWGIVDDHDVKKRFTDIRNKLRRKNYTEAARLADGINGLLFERWHELKKNG